MRELKYKQQIIFANNKSEAFKKLRLLLKKEGLKLHENGDRKIIRYDDNSFKIYYKTQIRKRK